MWVIIKGTHLTSIFLYQMKPLILPSNKGFSRQCHKLCVLMQASVLSVVKGFILFCVDVIFLQLLCNLKRGSEISKVFSIGNPLIIFELPKPPNAQIWIAAINRNLARAWQNNFANKSLINSAIAHVLNS